MASVTIFSIASGSAIEGINAPEALFGVFTQTMPAGGPPPASFLTTQNSFSTGIANPANFNPLSLKRRLYPRAFSVADDSELVHGSAAADRQGHGDRDLHTTEITALRLPIIADYNQAAPNQPGGTLTYQQRAPVPTFGPITWVDPAGNNHYNGVSARLEHRLSGSLYFLNSFTWGAAIGDSEQALEYYAGYVEANPQNIHNLAAEAGPSSYDVKFNNVTSVVYELPFGRGRKFGAQMNPVLDGILGGWELNTINTAHTGTPLNVYYTPTTANAVSGLSNDYRGEPFLRPNVSGSAASQSASQSINTYFAGYTFTVPPVNDPFGNLGRNAFRAPGIEQWDLAADKKLPYSRRLSSFNSARSFLTPSITQTSDIPNTNYGASSFGTIRATYPARQIQFALKLLF